MTDSDRILVAKHKRAVHAALGQLVELVGYTQARAYLNEVHRTFDRVVAPIQNPNSKIQNPPLVLTGPGGDFTQAHNFEPRSAEPMIVGAEAQI